MWSVRQLFRHFCFSSSSSTSDLVMANTCGYACRWYRKLTGVDKDIEPKYYGLIHNFYQKTGVPILLNTSFNENEPIVNTPEEALNCFLRTQMDMLVLEDIVIVR